MCQQDYVRSPDDTYGDPWKFREQLYKYFAFEPSLHAKGEDFVL